MVGKESLSTQELHELLLSALGDAVKWCGPMMSKPLEIDVALPYLLRLRVYMYNCTNPPGGRPKHEYKIQLKVPGQKRSERGHFDWSDGRIVLIMAYAHIYDNPSDGVFVLYDALYHMDFAYCANLQLSASIMSKALIERVGFGTKKTGEIIIAAQKTSLLAAIDSRLSHY